MNQDLINKLSQHIGCEVNVYSTDDITRDDDGYACPQMAGNDITFHRLDFQDGWTFGMFEESYETDDKTQYTVIFISRNGSTIVNPGLEKLFDACRAGDHQECLDQFHAFFACPHDMCMNEFVFEEMSKLLPNYEQLDPSGSVLRPRTSWDRRTYPAIKMSSSSSYRDELIKIISLLIKFYE
jgi:hypothetical protein